jgi:hypothetical protein
LWRATFIASTYVDAPGKMCPVALPDQRRVVYLCCPSA